MTGPGTAERPLRVAIVGSGPSGFYAAGQLLHSKQIRAEVDLFERLPTPWGLVRGGVAPDHPKIKSVSRVYEKIAKAPDFRFFGNVEVGRDVHHSELVAWYDAVLYAIGTVPNESGRVVDAPRTYVAGWIKRGPSGVIGTNKKCATDTVSTLLDDLAAGRLHATEPRDPDAIGRRADRSLPRAHDVRRLGADRRGGTYRRRGSRAAAREFTTIDELLDAAGVRSGSA
jgi:NADPH-dependent glutamate synthase beta subunit-like oxidoreductase